MAISSDTIDQYKTLLGLDSLPLAWTEKDLDRLGVRSIHSLRRDRITGDGIPFVKSKGAVRYCVLDVIQFMEKNTHTSTSQNDNR